ncbi:MAG: hypothetical protein ACC707_17420 [Thiohalomonadales bacterium]
MYKLNEALGQELLTTTTVRLKPLYQRLSIARLLGVAGLLLTVSACSTFGSGDGTVDGALVFYTEREGKGQQPFKTRIFVTKEFLRLSDDRAKDDFILFDREDKIIYNVNSADKTIMVIESQEVKTKPPMEIDYQEQSQPSAAIPSVDGNSATHFRYSANGEHCYDVVSLGPKFIPELGKAMSEFRQVLAGEHSKTISSTPSHMLDACDLALNVYHPADHLKNGFPLREWGPNGYSRFIIYYRTKDKMEEKYLELPDGYERFSISGS